MTETPLLNVRGLRGGYSHRASHDVLHDIDMTVTAGGSHAIIGESGSGKSTLGKMLVGQLRPRDGHIEVDGIDVPTLPRRQRVAAQRRVQMISQDPNGSLDPFMTIEQSIAEAIDPKRPNPRRDGARIDSLLRMVTLDTDARRRRPRQFSGGQRQRIAIARALAAEPDLIVADEVTSALDATVQSEILALLRKIRHEQSLSIVFITHDLEIARYLCDDVTVIHHGRIVDQGTVALLDSPTDDYTRELVRSVPDAEGRFLDA